MTNTVRTQKETQSSEPCSHYRTPKGKGTGPSEKANFDASNLRTYTGAQNKYQARLPFQNDGTAFRTTMNHMQGHAADLSLDKLTQFNELWVQKM